MRVHPVTISAVELNLTIDPVHGVHRQSPIPALVLDLVRRVTRKRTTYGPDSWMATNCT
jgi:hypothetical protein